MIATSYVAMGRGSHGIGVWQIARWLELAWSFGATLNPRPHVQPTAIVFAVPANLPDFNRTIAVSESDQEVSELTAAAHDTATPQAATL